MHSCHYTLEELYLFAPSTLTNLPRAPLLYSSYITLCIFDSFTSICTVRVFHQLRLYESAETPGSSVPSIRFLNYVGMVK
uniref:Uncharacterized protein n=1 Tax=Anguilla anguilla TaxID=7936 RepID=A0A0E9S406_ANGAN